MAPLPSLIATLLLIYAQIRHIQASPLPACEDPEAASIGQNLSISTPAPLENEEVVVTQTSVITLTVTSRSISCG